MSHSPVGPVVCFCNDVLGLVSAQNGSYFATNSFSRWLRIARCIIMIQWKNSYKCYGLQEFGKV